jgi:hypothetical protein
LAADPNVLPNGDFSNTSMSTGWQKAFGDPDSSMTWSSEDADGVTGSGSLQLTTGSTGKEMQAISTCVPVQPGAPFTFGGQARRPAGGDAVYLDCYTNSTPCGGAGVFNHVGKLDISGNNGTAWGAAVSMSGVLSTDGFTLTCSVLWSDATGAPPGVSTVLVDNLFFNTPLATPVRLQSFTVE